MEIQDSAVLLTSHQYRSPPPKKIELEAHMRKVLKEDLIMPSYVSHCALVVLIRNKNGKNDLCVDYRQLNKVIKDDPHPWQLF